MRGDLSRFGAGPPHTRKKKSNLADSLPRGPRNNPYPPTAMSIYASAEERDLDHALINTLGALKEHCDLPAIDKRNEPNPKRRKRMQYERGVKTRELRAEASSARAAWKTWKLANEPQHRCECGHNFKTHISRQDNTKSVCFTCLLREPAFQAAFAAKIIGK